MKAAGVWVLMVAVVALAVACDDGAEEKPEATSTPRPIPSPVSFAPDPAASYVLGDPTFEALPGATAYSGPLGGSIYQIEMPDSWNGRLVLYLHGSRDVADLTLTVDQPGIRDYLVRNGFAWGASSFSSNVPNLSGLAADETAALWDLFVGRFGRPQRTYVTGHSMGGGGAAISAERYPDRYDGALSLCGIGGFTAQAAWSGDSFVAAAFLADITQAEVDSTGAVQLIDSRILPALADAQVRERFESMVLDLTGGPRPFAHEGFLFEDEVWRTWAGTKLALAAGVFDNRRTVYRLGPLSDVPSEQFNATAVRVSPGPLLEALGPGNDATGNVQIPLLTLHTTGDLRVPITAAQLLRHLVEAAGKGDLLVQRTVRAPGHCTFANAEWEVGLEDLIAWVERGQRPEGEDLLVDSLREIGGEFTLAPRLGSPEAEQVPGADERITVRGTLTLDGAPLAGTLARAVVRQKGLGRWCNYRPVPVPDGRYEVTVAGDGEARGCGGPGAQLYLTAFAGGQFLASQEIIEWPADIRELTFDATFSSEDPTGVGRPATIFTGSVLDSSGESLPAGTVIEAYIGDTLCGVTSLPPVVMLFDDPAAYIIAVVGPEAGAGCQEGAAISFRVDGKTPQQTAVHDLAGFHTLNLTLP